MQTERFENGYVEFTEKARSQVISAYDTIHNLKKLP
jgi:hypothetical protein